MIEKQVQMQTSVEEELFKGGFWIFVFYACLIFSTGEGNFLHIFLEALLLKSVSAHLCRNELNRAAGSALSFLSLFIIIPLAGTLESRIAALPFYIRSVSVLKLNSAVWVSPVVQGVLAVVLTILVCNFWSAVSKIIPEKKAGRKGHERILLIHRFIVYFFLGATAGFLLKITCAYLQFSAAYGWFFQLAGIVLPFLFISRIRREIAEELKKIYAEAEEGPKTLTIPDTKLSDVAGMEDVKRQLYLTMINPLREKKQAERYGIKAGGGLLLYGPPGNGKTFLARAVAGELKLPFYAITSADIFAKYVGESEQNIKKIFEMIRKNKAAVLFIDELESIFRRRSDDIHETTRNVISLLLQELDGIQTHENSLLFIGATNTPWLIDEAFMRSGRFDSRIFVGLPDYAARLQILRQGFRNMSCPVPPELLEKAAQTTEGFCGADLTAVSNQVKQLAFERKARICGEKIFAEVLSHASPSVNQDIMRQIKEWENGCRF